MQSRTNGYALANVIACTCDDRGKNGRMMREYPTKVPKRGCAESSSRGPEICYRVLVLKHEFGTQVCFILGGCPSASVAGSAQPDGSRPLFLIIHRINRNLGHLIL